MFDIRLVFPQTGTKTEKTTSKVRQGHEYLLKCRQNYEQSKAKARARRSEILNFQF